MFLQQAEDDQTGGSKTGAKGVNHQAGDDNLAAWLNLSLGRQESPTATTGDSDSQLKPGSNKNHRRIQATFKSFKDFMNEMTICRGIPTNPQGHIASETGQDFSVFWLKGCCERYHGCRKIAEKSSDVEKFHQLYFLLLLLRKICSSDTINSRCIYTSSSHKAIDLDSHEAATYHARE
ncbi:hypothetical protein MRB53_024058 [Persea americana]|uniref:Uncharacterized protein n=1 Tax=Persea americana TaxID=3435 RepID=A0ACC2LBB2_PERAE|nr:hypothetical protein MRB53_024058 [Persea americana]